MRVWVLVAMALAGGACGHVSGSPESPAARPAHAPSNFTATQVRQPAVFVRLNLGAGSFSEQERETLGATYEGALLEALDRRGVPPRDAQRVSDSRFDTRAAVTRAREVGADHALVVHVSVERGRRVFCRDRGRPFEATTTVWEQRAQLIRVSDGATRVSLAGSELTVSDVEPDCDTPRASRRRQGGETVSEAISRLLGRLLGS